MNEISQFRGLAGEVVRGFVRPGIFFTLIPVFIYWLIILVGLFFLGDKIGTALSGLVVFASGVALVGRFALPASKGDLHTGFFNVSKPNAPGELLGFCARYICAFLEWTIPLTIIAYFGLGDSVGLIGSGVSGIGRMGFSGLLALTLTILFILGPTLCLIVALSAESVSEAVSLDSWRSLWHFRRGDLIVFYASAFGGVMIFFAIYAIPLAVLVFLAFAISLEAGIFVSGFVYMVPGLASPVLLGRLCGAFVIGGGLLETSSVGPAALGNLDIPTTIGVSAGKQIDAASVQAQVEANSDSELPSAIVRAGERIANDKEDLAAYLELTLLHKKAGELDKAKETASKTLALAALRNDSQAAVVAFKALDKERFKISATSSVHEKLSDALLEAGHYGDAGWCVNTALADQAGKEQQLQKKLIAIADAAASAGSMQEAAALYTFFLKKFPESSFSDYVKKALDAATLK